MGSKNTLLKQILVCTLTFGIIASFSLADEDRDSGFVINISETGARANKSGNTTQLSALIQSIDKEGRLFSHDSEKLLKDRHLQIHVYFPDALTEVTSRVKFEKGKDGLGLTFLTPPLAASDLNEFIVQITETRFDLADLMEEKAKVEAKILAAQKLLQDLKMRHGSQDQLEESEELLKALVAIVRKIDDKLHASPEILSSYQYPLQVDNQVAQAATSSVLIDRLRYSISLSPGMAIQGEPVDVAASVTNTKERPSDDFEKDGLILNLTSGATILSSQKVTTLAAGASIQLKGAMQNVQPAGPTVSLSLIDQDKKKSRTIAGIKISLPVLQDSVPPVWSVQAAIAPKPYLKALGSWEVSLSDSFGLINPDTVKALLSGTTTAGKAINSDICSQVQILPVGQGQSYTYAATGPQLADGDYAINLYGQDYAANLPTPSPFSAAFTIDTVPPQIKITNPVGPYTNKASQTVNLQYSDLHLDVSTLAVTINGVAWANNFTAGANSAQYTGTFQDGQYSITAQVADLAGNVGTAQPVSFMVDTTPPHVTIQAITSPTNNKNPAVSVTLTDTGSGVDPTTLSVSLDGNDITGSFALSGANLSGNLALSADGSHTVTVSVFDRAGNVGTGTTSFVLDTRPPKLTLLSSLQKVTAQLPAMYNILVQADKALSSGSVNGQALSVVNGNQLSGTIQLSSAGVNALSIQATDTVGSGNVGSLSATVSVEYDNDTPIITSSVKSGILTNQLTYNIPISIQEQFGVVNTVLVNSVPVMFNNLKSFTINAQLVEGPNLISVSSIDDAGNQSAPFNLTITRDTTPPTLATLSPANGATIYQVSFPISGKASEPLSSISVNGQALTLAADQVSFSGSYYDGVQGAITLTFTATDLAGNQSVTTVGLQIRTVLLQAQLVSVVPDPDVRYLIVVGAPGAARPGVDVLIRESMISLNRVDTTAASDGSFSARLSRFTSAAVIATDLNTKETAQATVQFGAGTTLSGIVKDTSGVPLPNATVTILGAGVSGVTDSAGSFSLNSPVAGDQQLQIDGSTIPQTVTGPNRSFSTTLVSISLGLGQANVFPRPIFLAPLIQDGSETPVAKGHGATVSNAAAAPGVQISIPAVNPTTGGPAVIFPNGSSNSGVINIATIPSGFSTVTVPNSAIPDNVVALEPSGLAFNQRVDVTLPNDNDLPAGTDLVVLSMNSRTGQWEIDGNARVSPDGKSVQTKPGEGISHFSLIYAIPSNPVLLTAKDPNFNGVDASKGSLSTSISLPAYKSLGQSVVPTFTYKSNWANPTAYISQLLDIPKTVINFDYTTVDNRPPVISSESQCMYVVGIPLGCDAKTWMTTLQFDTRVQGSVAYVPDSIRSQFFVSGLASSKIVFQDTTNPPANTNPAASVLPGATLSNSINSQIIQMSGIPSKSVISYAVPLQDSSGNYLASGLYPTLTRYEIRLKALTMTTVTSTATLTVKGLDFNYYNSTTVQKTLNSNTTQLLDSAMPQDVIENMAVINKVNSSVGRGWKFAGNQQIINPVNNNLVIEEADGSLSSYVLNDTITTVFNDQNSIIDFGNAIDISNFPKAIATTFQPYQARDFVQIDLLSGSINDLGPSFQDTAPIDDYYCGPIGAPGQAPGFVTQYIRHGETHVRGLRLTSDGSLYYSHDDNSIDAGLLAKFSIGSQQSVGLNQLLTTSYIPTFQGTLLEPTSTQLAQSQYFSEVYLGPSLYTSNGIDKEVFNVVNQSFNLVTCLYGVADKQTAPSNGVVPLPSSRAGNIARIPSLSERQASSDFFYDSSVDRTAPNLSGDTMKLNHSGEIIIGPDGNLYIANTGNNTVNKLVQATNTQYVVAGSYLPNDFGDGGQAVNAGIYHPRGLAFDDLGNLYVSSDNGYIRKVDTAGNITTFAGSGGTAPVTESYATQMAFSSPSSMVFDRASRSLFISDTGFNRVVRIDLNTMMASTVAGSPSSTCPSDPGDNGPASMASLCSPTNLGLDSNGNLLIVDSGHKRIRKVSFSAVGGGALTYVPTSQDLSGLVRNADGSFTRTYRSGRTVNFNTAGYETSSVDRVGNTTSFSYDTNNNLISINDPVGQSATFNYSGNQLKTFTDPAGRQAQFTFNGSLLASVTFPDGTSKSFSYDQNGQMIEEVNQRGGKTDYTYNAYNRLAQVSDPAGNVTIVNDSASQSMTNSFTGGSSMRLQPSGVGPTQIGDRFTNASNTTTTFAKDFNGFISIIQDPQGNVTTIHRDIHGNPLRITYPDQTSKSFVYDPNTFDLLTTIDNTLGITESQTYDQYGNQITKTDGNGNTTTYAFDSHGLLTQVALPGGRSRTYTYNSNGQLLSETVQVSSKQGLTTFLQYDNHGNVISKTTPDGNTVKFQYDAVGNVIQKIESISFPLQAITQFAYDGNGRLSKVTSPKGEVTTYSYLPTGELAQIVDPVQGVTTFQYDSRGKPTKKTDPLGYSYQYSYDAVGNLTAMIDPNGSKTSFSYDALNHMTLAAYADDSIQYTYSQRGDLISVVNRNSAVTYTRNSKGWITSASVAGIGPSASYPSSSFAYSYDNVGNRTQASSGLGLVNYTYDSANRLNALSTSWGQNYSFFFDGADRLYQINRPGSTTGISYVTNGPITNISHSPGSSVAYTYDSRNNITSRNDTISGLISYTFDLNGQLLSTAGLKPETFTYDVLGNRLSDSNGIFSYGASSQRLMSDAKYSYSYDNNGNLVAKSPKNPLDPAYTYTYSSKNQLIEVRVSGGSPAQLQKDVVFTYDVLGRRIQKQVTDYLNVSNSFTRQFMYDGQNIVAEFDQNGTLLATHTHSGLKDDDILGSVISSTGVMAGLAGQADQYFYLKDVIGSVTDVTSSSGAILQSYAYSSFGTTTAIQANGQDISASPALKTAYRFAGREWDDEVGLYFNRARSYDPNVGRFLQQDSDPGKLSSPISLINKYLYTMNNPLSFTDPSGMFSLFGLEIGGDFGNLLQRASDYLSSPAGQKFLVGLAAATAAVLVAPAIVAAAGVGTVGGIFLGALTGAIAGGIAGGVAGGLINVWQGGSFSAGFQDNVWQSVLIGATSGAIAGGLTPNLQFFGTGSQLSTDLTAHSLIRNCGVQGVVTAVPSLESGDWQGAASSSGVQITRCELGF